MKHRAGALVFLAVLFGGSACGSGHAAPRVTQPSVPSKHGSYAWQPIPGGPSLVCSVRYRQSAHELIDYGGRPYYCKLPSPAHREDSAGIDFFGPSTVAAGAVPLKPHQLRLHIDFNAPNPAVLRVDFGDGTHWQRSVTYGTPPADVVHAYAPTPHAYLLVTLRDKTGYMAVEGEGPFRAPLHSPRTRYCSYIADGKGGTLSATKSLTCAEAERLYAHYVSAWPHGTPRGYRCHSYGLPPWGSDVAVTGCTSSTRAFVFTSNA